MTKIKVGFRPVVSHINFTMLIGRHRARIDVQIGIELPNAHTITPRLQQCCKACRHKAFAKRGNHAAGDENEPRHGRKGYPFNITTSKRARSEEHKYELQSLMRHSYAVFRLKTRKKNQ